METISDDPVLQAEYEEAMRNGASHNLAKMCVLRAPPGILTDQQWNMGRSNNNQFADCPALGNYYQKIASAAGVSTTGKYYVHGLGRFPGDPRAWCRGRGEVLAIAEERNLTLDGLVKHQGHAVEPTPPVAMAEDLIDGYAQDVLHEHPGISYEDAREKAFAKHGPQDVPRDDLDGIDVAESIRQTIAEMSVDE